MHLLLLFFLRALRVLRGQFSSNLPQNKPTTINKQTQMKKTTTLATVVAVTLMGSALCHAQEDKRQKQFNKLDADKSGTLTLVEYTSINPGPEREAAFAARDTDKDGSLTLVEFSTAPAKK
jgi:Ca2+-binding EF-hand superfamily protein